MPCQRNLMLNCWTNGNFIAAMSPHLPIPIAAPAYHVGMIHRAITTLQLRSELSQMRHKVEQIWIRQLRETSRKSPWQMKNRIRPATTARADRSEESALCDWILLSDAEPGCPACRFPIAIGLHGRSPPMSDRVQVAVWRPRRAGENVRYFGVHRNSTPKTFNGG